MDRRPKPTARKAARLLLIASFTWQSWLCVAEDAQQKITRTNRITRKRANFAGENGEDGGSRKTFQRVPGQTCPVNVPGTLWSEDFGSDAGPVQIEEENAPSTFCAERAEKISEENITTSRAWGGKEVEGPGKTFQGISGQTSSAEVPGTGWLKKHGSQCVLGQNKEVNAPSTPGFENYGKHRDESIPVPKGVKAHLDKISNGTLASFTWQPWLFTETDAQRKISTAYCITKKRATPASEDEEDGGSKKSFQSIPSQICPVNVPGTHCSADGGNDDGPVQTKDENAPSTPRVERSVKGNQTNITTSRARGGKEVVF